MEGKLRILVLVTVLAAAGAAAQAQQAPAPAQQKPAAAPAAPVAKLPREPMFVGTINDIMGKFLYPVADEVFYIGRGAPKTEKDWNAYEARMLMLAEAGNLLMMPGRAKDNDRWMRDARLLVDAGNAAYKAAKARDVAALEALNDQMYQACVVCHQDFRPNYRARVPDPEGFEPLMPLPPPPPARGK
jgi:hypothetical protein